VTYLTYLSNKASSLLETKFKKKKQKKTECDVDRQHRGK